MDSVCVPGIYFTTGYHGFQDGLRFDTDWSYNLTLKSEHPYWPLKALSKEDDIQVLGVFFIFLRASFDLAEGPNGE